MRIESIFFCFSHGRALFKMGEYNRAMEQLQLALTMEPNNELTIKEIRLVNINIQATSILKAFYFICYFQVNENQRKYAEIEKQLWSKCLKTQQKEKKQTTFEEAARKMCETFSQDSQLLRQSLPESLTPEEDKCIREQAAAFGLLITTHQRYGREITFLNKPSY